MKFLNQLELRQLQGGTNGLYDDPSGDTVGCDPHDGGTIFDPPFPFPNPFNN